MVSKHKQKAYERAEDLAREIRRQISAVGGCYDNLSIFALLEKWMRVAGQRSYYSPEEIKRRKKKAAAA
jgi:hypothetical protein